MSIDILPKPNIIYKDKDFLVIEKPAGMLVHPTKYQKENTLIDWLLKYYPEIKKIGPKERPGIVHRLDRNVSGLMVIAKTEKAFKHLIEQFKNNRVKKEYLALVFGKPVEKKGTINLPIGWTRKGKLVAVKNKRKIKLEKQAMTEYEIIETLAQFSLLKVKPLTGRTNQIRIHLKAIGCPIVGDQKYSTREFKKSVVEPLSRIFLHASYLSFYNISGQRQKFRSELPIKLSNFLNKIGGKYV